MTTAPIPTIHRESHRVHRVGWLRAAVLGANDGIVSTASLVIGVASAGAGHREILIAGVAGLVAGAMSMAAGEYVSVSSQADTEQADLQTESLSLRENFEEETRELAEIYMQRGLDAELAGQVAEQLMARDPLEAHARDELGLSHTARARPVQAALSSALSFALGAALPVAAVLAAPFMQPLPFIPTAPLPPAAPIVAAASLISLALLGAAAARAGGAPVIKGALRVTFWGTLAMAVTAAAGSLFAAWG